MALKKKALIVFVSNLRSTVGEKYTHKELAMVRLSPYIRDIIIGEILVDG
jgi:hypothetical protein